MGGNTAKVALPLIALAGVGIATGGFGLLGSAAASASTGMTAAQAATTYGISMADAVATLPALQAASSPSWLGIASAAAGGLNAVAGIGADMGQQKIQQARDKLQLAEQERDTQRKLQKSLAVRNNRQAELGVDASSGSALLASEAAKQAADREMSLFGAQRSLNGAASTIGRRSNAFALADAIGQGLSTTAGEI